jgi:2-keto-4-pentenoate hydratase/2-oxohepta-3-ene-1,7-dioic acid hydratase in catechol pathway
MRSRNGLPIDRPGKIVCVGLNYRDHATEAGLDVPERPVLFAKWATALIGPDMPIVLPRISSQVDYEAELGIIIGRRVRALSPEDALDAVAGFICVNDVSARDLQFEDGQWTRAKSLDTFCPIGPSLVPVDDVPDPQRLRIRCLLNGEVVQDSSTENMIFSCSELIAFISEAIELEPGDLIATGTPAGVGFTRRPPLYLSRGDEVTVDIEHVGTLTNPVR